MAAGKSKWGVAYYKQDYPERDLDDDVVRAPPPLASFFYPHTQQCTHIIDNQYRYAGTDAFKV